MNTVKLHLEQEEYQPLVRLARELNVNPEDVLYAGLNRIMHEAHEDAARREITSLRSARTSQLPNWADHSREIHAYESMT